jgi:putative pyruvate formate lyase activating enzyme
MMTICMICPRGCSVDRSIKPGICGISESITAARAALHFWEEPCISGERGSGTVFFSGCPLKCIFCQNAEISHERFGKEITGNELMRIFDRLVEQGAHNINLVSPTHFAPKIAEVLRVYKSPVPVVYNSSGYETIETLKSLEGLVDIYLPDLKYFDGAVSKKYANAENYFEFASKAVLEMQKQVGTLQLDKEGIALRGLMVRHLVLPGNVTQTIKIMRWLKDSLPGDTAISLMSQYTPHGEAVNNPPLNRKITKREYERAVNAMLDMGFENGYVQELDSAGKEFIPAFNLEGITQEGD